MFEIFFIVSAVIFGSIFYRVSNSKKSYLKIVEKKNEAVARTANIGLKIGAFLFWGGAFFWLLIILVR
jgi:hypothetical protein